MNLPFSGVFLPVENQVALFLHGFCAFEVDCQGGLGAELGLTAFAGFELRRVEVQADGVG